MSEIEPSSNDGREIDPSSTDPVSTKKNYDDTGVFSGPELTPEQAQNLLFVSLPAGPDSLVASKAKDLQRLSKTSEALQDWYEDVKEGQSNGYSEDALMEAARRPDARWVSGVDGQENRKLRAGAPRILLPENQALTGDRWRMAVRDKLKIGTYYTVPLWHSGFWITMRGPDEGAYLELQLAITQLKGALGRQTYGAIFSNSMVYVKELVLDFAIRHITETTLAVGQISEIRKYIQQADLGAIEWCLAAVLSPKGINYSRSCIASPSECQHVYKAILNPAECLVADETRLTPWQRDHMDKRRRGTVDPALLERYRQEFTTAQNRRVQVSDDLALMLKMPTADEFFSAGKRWVVDIESGFANALTMEDTRRDAYLMDQGRATRMRQYSGMIDSIIMGEYVNSNPDDIATTLNDLSSLDGVFDKYLKGVVSFISASTMSMVALRPHECPKCKKPQTEETDSIKSLLPIDPIQVFFSLMVQKVDTIGSRTFGT